MGATEEFFHVFGGAAGFFVIIVDTIFEFDGTDRTQGALVAKYEINGFVFDEFVGGVTILGTDFVAKEGRKADLGDDVEFLTEEVVEHLEALFGGADHEVLAGAVFEAADGFALATTVGDADENRHQKQG